MPALRDPISLRRGRDLPNRLVLAPMTNQQSNPGGTLSDDELDWLAARADGGFGLLQTAAAYVHPAGQVWPGQLGISDDRHLLGLKRLTARIAAAGARSSVQLHHGGVRANPEVSRRGTVGPWADSRTGARALTTEEINQAVIDFADAAVRAEIAGFDGIEVHGGHGFLVGQFLDAANNLREDGYGGDPGGRSRFVKEVVEAIRDRTGPEFHVGLRLSIERHGQVLGDMIGLVTELFAGGNIDVLDLSLWDVRKLPANATAGSPLLIEHFLGIPRNGTVLGVAGGITTAPDAQRVLDEGADLAYVGKSAIADHAFASRAILDPTYRPQGFPVTRDHLRMERLGDAFIDYFSTNWPALVED